MLQNNAWRDNISLWIIPDLILLGILQECAKAEMEGAPGLVGVLKRKINGRKHSESYFSLGTPLLCWSVSASKQRKDPSREIQHKWAFPLPLMENFITWPFSWWLFDGFMGWGVPSWGMGTVCCPCPSRATLKEKKKWENKLSSDLVWELFWTLKMDNLSFWEAGRELSSTCVTGICSIRL